MPNWCATTYRFRGDENELNVLYNKIMEWTSKEYTKTDFGDIWLGNILHGAGLADRIDADDESLNLRCRGTLIDIDSKVYGDYFDLVTDTAWVPMAKMWDAVIEKLNLKTIGYTFMAEESGCGLYWIYDPHNYGDFKEEVYIDSDGEDAGGFDGYYSEQDAIKYLNEFFRTEYDDIDEFIPLCEKYNEAHEDDDNYIYVNRFDRISEVYE